jgi:uncharacterized membrane protein YvlD (DUF360 family)
VLIETVVLLIWAVAVLNKEFNGNACRASVAPYDQATARAGTPVMPSLNVRPVLIIISLPIMVFSEGTWTLKISEELLALVEGNCWKVHWDAPLLTA